MSEPPVTDALVQLSHLVQHVFADVSREHGLTPQQVQLLCRLKDGPVGMSELGRMLHLEKSSLSGLVDRVEQRGLVDRQRDAQDRRVCSIELTTEGRKLALAAYDDVTERLGELTGLLTHGDRTQLGRAVGRLLAVSRAT